MKTESQHTEYKQSWRDEYLKVICAFANTNGGTLYIGIDDQQQVVGMKDARKLQEDLPSKTKDILGILPDVTLKKERTKEYLCIRVKPYSNPISYKGKYYCRSGSTTQELNGIELQSFILRKSGLTWEDMVEPEATITKDIDKNTIEQFKRLAGKKDKNILKETSTIRLLEKLHLTKKGKLTRAALLLFGKNPQQYYPASYIKIGRFNDQAAPLSMDEIKGNLFQQISRTIELLKKKYLHSDISITTLRREERLEYPEVALREAIVNAIVHRDYAEVHTQVKVYPDQITIWNGGPLARGLTVDKLKKKHPSHPRNNRIANVFFKASYIESWGSGTIRIIEEFHKAGLPEPIFEEVFEGMLVTFMKDALSEENIHKFMLNNRQLLAIKYIKKHGHISNTIYQSMNHTSKRTATNDLQELVEKGLVTQKGATGKGTQYILQRGKRGNKGATKGQKGQ